MASLSSEEYALLNEFSYIDLPKQVKDLIEGNSENKNFGHILELLLTDYNVYLTKEQLKFVKELRTYPEIIKLEVVQYENKDSIISNFKDKCFVPRQEKDITGFAAIGFVSPEGNPIAVYRGSEPLPEANYDSDEDWVDNIRNMLLGRESTQYKQAEEFYLSLIEKGSGRPIVTGHSKGGNVAAYVISKFGDMDGYLFNPMPLHKNFINEKHMANSHIETYVANNDFIALLLSHFTEAEIKLLLENLSDEELKQLLNLKGKAIFNYLKTRGPLVASVVEVALARKGIDYFFDGEIRLFEEQFHFHFKRHDTYRYPGNITIVHNDLTFTKALDAHGLHNFYRNPYLKIEVDLNHIQNHIGRLNRINQRLDSLDSQLNTLLFRVCDDFSPFKVFQTFGNGFKIMTADLKVGKSKSISNCVKWLQTMDYEMNKAESYLNNQAHYMVRSPSNSNHRKQFL